jgi:4-hydroxythreonine-4-phosphate dehydrogenase
MIPIIALTMGDPGGIGPEIILKSLKKINRKKAFFVVIGSWDVFQYAAKRLKLPFQFYPVPALKRSFLKPGRVHFLDITSEAETISRKAAFSVGQISKWNAALAYSALKVAASLAAQGQIAALVTAPIQKMGIRLVDPKFLGHTEYLAQTAHAKEFAMMFVSDRLRVTLATIHLPIKKVAGALKTKEIASKIRLTHEFLKSRFNIKNPKIGVSALNPHGSEFGTEEEKIILPAIRWAAKKGIRVQGPLSGDQIFHEAYEGRLDAVLAMYHDQGLAPFKMIAFDEGVNVTLGLPFVRTSPDHGTAFNIAYRNKASETAFLNSIRLAQRMLTR